MSRRRKRPQNPPPARRIAPPASRSSAATDLAIGSSASLAVLPAVHWSPSAMFAPPAGKADGGEMGEGPGGRPMTPRGLVRAALLLLVPVLVSAAVAFAVASRMEPVYAAESDVVFDVGDRGDVLEKLLATQSVVVQSRATLEPVSRTYDIPMETLEKNLSVDFPKGGVVMRLQYADKDSETALRVIGSLVDNYVRVLGRVAFLNSAKYVLVPAFILDKPVSPKPLRAAALGAAVGLTLAIAALALARPLRAA
jgi:capsular polysaccharide biosynthesis protein